MNAATMEATKDSVSEVIFKQIGGYKFIAMTGATNLVGGNDHLQFSIPARSTKNGANAMRITLAADDTYTVEAFRLKNYGLDCTTLASVDGVHAANLCHVFTSITGMDASL